MKGNKILNEGEKLIFDLLKLVTYYTGNAVLTFDKFLSTHFVYYI